MRCQKASAMDPDMAHTRATGYGLYECQTPTPDQTHPPILNIRSMDAGTVNGFAHPGSPCAPVRYLRYHRMERIGCIVDISLLGMFPRPLLQQPRRILMAEIKNQFVCDFVSPAIPQHLRKRKPKSSLPPRDAGQDAVLMPRKGALHIDALLLLLAKLECNSWIGASRGQAWNLVDDGV
ncbi:hypothetical protein CI102_13916 [Trichoderma harzianum]|uniref:Uncharacterized protein n=1 Tax=Trichoderma harzianum CBS 226.95 TaxID=983964 RepID=A0A2T4A859_TRIHA|nr:hypothetical protein M431DRAFT_459495 [Trichoderma harzianum CBS 226.95]PKK41835.1 hypothetical protein CI102_13916 [Trichoderma harzianum]PTB53241.1 hypothetical protein M431DRAFT_459495 [Trichoderma harzianum CBS 226.95]